MESSLDDWLQPFEASSMNSGNDPGWLLDEEASRMTTAATGAEPPRRGRHATGGDDAATLLVKAFSIDDGEDAAAVDIADIVKFDAAEHGMATDSPDDLEQFFKQGGSEGLDTFLADVPAKEEVPPEVDVFDFRWDDEEELKLNGSDTEDAASSCLLLETDTESHASQMLLNSDLLSFDDHTLRSTLPASPGPLLSAAPLSSPSPSPQSTDSKGPSNPSSPAPSSSPLPSSPSSLLPVSSGVVFLQPQLLMQQHTHQAVSYSSCGAVPHIPTPTANVQTPPTTPAVASVMQSAPTTPSSSPQTSRSRRESGRTSKKAAGIGSTPPRSRRKRAASTSVARDKQDRLERELANDDKAKAILSGPLTLEKLASLSTLKVSVLQKQLRMVNASTKGSKAQLIQRLVRYMYLFSQQHRHQPHHHNALCLATCAMQQPTPSENVSSNRCTGTFVDPTLINAEFAPTPVRVKAERGIKRSNSKRDGQSSSDVPNILSSSAPAASFASFLSTHVFPSPLQITLTGRIVEEEEEEDFSD